MNVGATFIANHQAPKAMQPREIALGNPPIAAKPLTGFDSLACDAGRDPTCAQALHVFARTIPEVGMHLARPPSRPPTASSYRHNAINHHEKRDHVRHVGCREHGGRERQAVPVNDHVMLGAQFSAVRGVFAGLRAPLLAGACAESTDARDQSIAPARWSRSSRHWWTRCQTPACCQSRRRFQQVIPLHPSSCGRSSQGIPVRRTNTIPVNAIRSGVRGRPRSDRRTGCGSSGAMTAQSSSSMNFRAMLAVWLRMCRSAGTFSVRCE